MKRFILILSIIVFVVSCKKETPVYLELNKTDFHFGDTIKLKNSNLFANYSFNDLQKDYLVVDSSNFKRGTYNLHISAVSNSGENLDKSFDIKILSNKPSSKINYEIVNTFPHDSNLFTQGLLIKNNLIFEAAGLYNKSKIVSYKLGDKNFKSDLSLNPQYFSEGLTFFNNNFYNLTWKERVILKLNESGSEILEEIPFPTEIPEGWGITNNDENFFISDGSSYIYILDSNLKVINKIQIVDYDKIYDQINELEYHNGMLYANIWHEPKILKINPNTGEVRGIIDLTEVAKQSQNTSEEVLNGIAIMPNQNLLITGKNWQELYEIKLKD